MVLRRAIAQRIGSARGEAEAVVEMATHATPTPATAARVAGAGSRRTIEVENPATGQIIAQIPVVEPDQLAEVVACARDAQRVWHAMGFDGRGAVLRNVQRWMLDNVDRFIDTIVSETGKSHGDALIAEGTYAVASFGFWAKAAPKYLAEQKVKGTNPFVRGRSVAIRYEPLGVVGVIGPWNYPFTNSCGDAIPALAAGNAVVMKPSEITPLTSLLLQEVFRDCGMPDGVYQTVAGYGETGAALIDHVDFVMFTGSTAVGKKVMARAAETLTPVSLELGGKDPMVVLRDADLERAANTAVHSAFLNAGQTCISTERVYVEEPVYDRFVQLVVDKTRKLRQGRPAGPGSVDVGAMIWPPQSDTVEAHVKDAIEKGAKVLVGGRRSDDGGHFFEPTVLVEVDHTMACMRDETFGPTLPIMKVRDADEALRLANDSPFGLQTSLWTRDLRKGETLARRVESGVVTVNDSQVNYAVLEAPMGGWKLSGLGSRHGAHGIRKYCKQQSVLVNRLPLNLSRELFHYPYTRRRHGLLLTLLHWGFGFTEPLSVAIGRLLPQRRRRAGR
jgi:acyl-CoA reductase-like NAD-dependent aldehyde dehydrogenase